MACKHKYKLPKILPPIPSLGLPPLPKFPPKFPMPELDIPGLKLKLPKFPIPMPSLGLPPLPKLPIPSPFICPLDGEEFTGF